MPSRRELVAMNDEQVWAFINSQQTVQVASNGPNGWPHLVPLWFALDGEHIILESFSKAQKVVNLKRDERITLLFEDGHDQYEQLRGVMIYGRAQLVNGTDDFDYVVKQHIKVLQRNNAMGLSDADIKAAVHGMAAKKTSITVSAEKIVSWDHRKLAGVY